MSAWLPVVLYAALIIGASSIPSDRMPLPELWSYDKLLHAVEYFMLGALVARAFVIGPPRLSPALAFAVAVIAGAAFGGLDELYQSTTPGRFATPWDALADAVGASFGALAVMLWRTRKEPDGSRT